jgi:DNA-binding protein HU-beta
MNKTQLITSIAEKTGMSLTEAEKTLGTTIDTIVASLMKGEDVALMGFGRFGVKKRAARKVKNPQTGKEMIISDAIVPFFKAGKNLKELVDAKK